MHRLLKQLLAKFLNNHHIVFYCYLGKKNGNTYSCSFLFVNHLRKATPTTVCTSHSHINLIYQISIFVIQMCTHIQLHVTVSVTAWFKHTATSSE